jgi:hypothetical protein
MTTYEIPGQDGSLGPFRGQDDRPHVYARDIQSGAGNCVCGSDLPSALHTEAAPGVPIPEGMRHADHLAKAAVEKSR